MKNVFTLVVLICFSFTAANAQDKAAVKAERVTKVESKEVLKKAQAQPKKIDAATFKTKRANMTHIDSQTSKGTLRTNAIKGTPVKKNSTKTLETAPTKIEK
jgi:hypothetical protein